MTSFRKTLFWRYKENLVVGGIGFIGILLTFGPMIFSHSLPHVRDFMPYVYPHLHFWRTSILAGEIPFWNPYIFGGVDFLADPMTSTLYPLNLILLLPLSYSIPLFLALHFLIAYFSMYYLCRSFGANRTGAILGAYGFAFSGYMLSMVHYFTKIRGLVWVPLFLALWKKSQEEEGYTYTIYASIVLALLVLSGHLFLVYFLGFFTLLYFLGFQKKRSWKRAFSLVIVGLLLSSLQWLPSILVMDSTVRKNPLTSEEACKWSMPPKRALEWLAPTYLGIPSYFNPSPSKNDSTYWSHSIYFGSLLMALAILSLLRLSFSQKGFWLILFLLSFCLALGKNFIFFPFFKAYFPLLDRFRYPEKFIFWSIFSLSLLGSLAWKEEILSYFYSKRILFLLLGFFLAFLLAPLGPWKADYGKKIYFLPFAAGIVSSLFFFVYFLSERKKKVSHLLLFIGLFLGHLAKVHLHEIPLIKAEFYQKIPQSLKDLPKETYQKYRIARIPPRKIFMPLKTGNPEKYLPWRAEMVRETLLADYPMIWRIFSIQGMSPAILHRAQTFWQTLIDKDMEIPLTLAGVRYIMSSLSYPVMRKKFSLYKVYPEMNSCWLENPKARKRIQFFRKVCYYADEKEVEKELTQKNLYQICLVENPTKKGQVNSYGSGKAKFIKYGLNRVEIEVECKIKSFMVLFENYQKGWMAYLDGKEIPIYPSYLTFRGMEIPKGRHFLVMVYRPLGWNLSLYLFFLGLMGGSLLFYFHKKAKKNEG
ncbi:MAG: hypothetical protein D6785_06215 [Planctomycetota bacterium]|nr:MAG: hypothetical protein D6785_06215 [Planctomycetota bacterium]